jgi:chemosensory pili system protein ChpA (sensor histidine kinase/response regulator)
MIVDDSVTVRKVTSRLMERQGWKVVTAKDGLDAVEQLQDIYPDIVLLDIEMPKMDGFEVLRTARRDARLKNLPIIMITSRTGEKHKQQAFALGVNAYLGKPFQEAGLMSTIEEVLAETKAQVLNE